MKTSLDKMKLPWTQKKTQGQDMKKPDGEGQMDVDPESRRRMRGKTRLTSLEQPSAPTANTGPDTTQHETKEDHDYKRRRIDPNQQFPQLLRMKFWYRALRHLIRLPEMMRVAVDVPLLEETMEMSGENSQGWITEEAFFTVSPVHDRYGSARR